MDDLAQALSRKLGRHSRREIAKAIIEATATTLVLTLIGAAIVIYGLQFMGLDIEYSITSFCGTALVLTGLRLAT